MPEADLDSAIVRAADLLRASRAPAITGHFGDLACIVAAFRLAEKLGAVIDHAAAESALREQAVLQDVGVMAISPAEGIRRADTVLVLGDRPFRAWPELPDLLFGEVATARNAVSIRRVVEIASRALGLYGKASSIPITSDPSELPQILGAVRARINGRPLARDFDRASEVAGAVGALKAAKFGVALWSSDEIDALTIEMLTGLIKDLNIATRWSGLVLRNDATLTAAAVASGWLTGLPLRISFARGRPEHDPWLYDVRRLVESKEADTVVWISGNGDQLPEWLGGVATVLLTPTRTSACGGSMIMISTALAGRDHDAVIFDPATGTLVEAMARAPGSLPSAADVLNRIARLACPS